MSRNRHYGVFVCHQHVPRKHREESGTLISKASWSVKLVERIASRNNRAYPARQCLRHESHHRTRRPQHLVLPSALKVAKQFRS
ncbi:hypothetical protein RHECNPAF_1330052 [Rhizobium etli CNPAF512]|nr:hypothetical protein RHECNPAF_1330052 [Rhizobium etli CNPAF512]